MVEIHARPETEIELGRRGENLAHAVLFDVADWEREYGAGVVHLLHRRPDDTAPYPCPIEVTGTQIRWEIADTDIANVGRGRAELQYYVDDVIVKSQIYHTRTFRALDDAGPVPDAPEKTWVEQVLAAGERAAAGAAASERHADNAKIAADQANDAADAAGKRLEELNEAIEKNLVQSDYAQNDSTDNSYIKNRPFYEDETGVHQLDDKFLGLLQHAELDLIVEQELSLTYADSMYGAAVPLNLSELIEEGREYVVEFGGKTDTLTAKCYNSTYYLGNCGLIYTWEQELNTGEDTVIVWYAGAAEGMICTSRECDAGTLRIYGTQEGTYRVRDAYLENTALARRTAALEDVLSDLSVCYPVQGAQTELQPEQYYVFGEVDSLAVTLVGADDARAYEYCFEFVPTENFTQLSVTPEPKWVNRPQFPAGHTCQVSVLRGIGVMVHA